jgi:hypothetical protein
MPRTAHETPELNALLGRQDGVASVEQLSSCGLSRNTVDKRVARGRWQRLLPAVILTSASAPSRRQLLVAAWLWAGPSSAIDGIDALRWHGVTLPPTASRTIHVVVDWDAPQRSRDFVVVRRAMAEIRVGGRGMVPYVDAPTAAIVAARNARNPREATSRLSRALQQRAVTTGGLAEARQSIGDKWCRPVDGALLAVGVGVRSPAEEDMRKLVLTSPLLPEPLWNQWLHLPDDGPDVCVDGLWTDAGLVNEVIGKKYHAWGEQYDDTNARKERLQAAGLIVCEATPTRIRQHGPTVLKHLETTYGIHRGRGMPPGVELIPPPGIA